jgi:dsDNA-specific endonuclease/ATPase MutS2
MGEDPRTAGSAVTDTSDPEEIRREIETTREELGDTVAALAAKADVKTQAKQKLEETKAAVTSRKDALLGKAKQGSPESATAAASQVAETARRNPVPLAASGVFALGFLAGWVMRR